ncbi:alpha/beta-hydrolase [Stipitochalara longipes BDJ]|nr:alpha/beta-hydrolase [Stipitochalara longipes BDJ]
MPSHQIHDFSPGAKAKLYFVLICVVIRCLLSFLINLMPRLAAGWSPARILAVSFMRSSLALLSFSQNRAISPPTGQAIKTFCQHAGLTCNSVDVPNDDGPPATLHYIHIADRPKARLLLYFPGGAYCNPINASGQLAFAIECARAAGASELVCLEYTLAPELKYPGQLIQAVDALDHILKTHHPSQIILGGDSAGGHLLLSLLVHIRKPNPAAKQLAGSFGPGRQLLGAVAISPWVSMKYNSQSFKQNASRDYVYATDMTAYTEMWNPSHVEVWGDLLAGDADIWSNLTVDNLLLTVGGWECFLDDVRAMASRLQAKEFGSGAKVELAVGKKEVHVQCAVDIAVRAPHGHGARDILSWLRRMTGEKGEGVAEEV